MSYRRHAILTTIALAWLALSSCSPPEPVRIGFLGGLSGRVTDLGIGGLNGVRLAVDQRNKAGGIKGRPIELIETDDQQDPEMARAAVARLIEHRVVAIVGPMTSAMAVATVPLIDQAKLVMVSPTVTTEDLSGLDDYFFRVIPSTREFVGTSAAYYRSVLGLRRVRLVYDLRNRSYSESWLNEFNKAFSATGGELLEALSFTSNDQLDFNILAHRSLAENPDGIILISNSVDAAMLCQSIRQHNQSIALGTSEWAATERLSELGGSSVEGVTVAQFFDRQSAQPAYVAIRDAYVKRFGQPPGFAGLLAFDAANVVLDALEKKGDDQSLKQAILMQRNFTGVQKPISFDASGDSHGGTFMVTLKNRTFTPIGTLP
jgi:branched-chain amino acid transport system substrate-binding protein